MSIKLINAEEFSKLLIIKGFTQRSFAGHIGISGPYFNQIINFERSPSPKVAKKICDGLGKEFNEIFFIQSDNKSYQDKTTA